MKSESLFIKPLFAFMSLVFVVNANGQIFSSDYKTIAVNKQVKEFPDKFDLSTPLNSFVTFKYTSANGKDGLFWKTSCALKSSLLPDSAAPDSNVPEETRQSYLNTTVREIIIYKDSVVFVISQIYQDNGEAYYSVRNFHPERGKWVNDGEDLFKTIPSAYKAIREHTAKFYEDFQECQKHLNGGGQNKVAITGKMETTFGAIRITITSKDGRLFSSEIKKDGTFFIQGEVTQSGIALINTNNSGSSIIWFEPGDYHLVCTLIKANGG